MFIVSFVLLLFAWLGGFLVFQVSSTDSSSAVVRSCLADFPFLST